MTPEPTPKDEQSSEKKFKDFLFVEYENIAKAHFESQKQMALFFRYYTIFFSVPIIIAGLWDNDHTNTTILNMDIFAGMFIVIGMIGISFYWITIELKHEAVLYARTVNGIRFYFYRELDKGTRDNILTLPVDIKMPKYHSRTNPVLMIMVVVNTVYFWLGLYFLNISGHCLSVLLIAGIVLGHFWLNKWLSKKQDKRFATIKFPKTKEGESTSI